MTATLVDVRRRAWRPVAVAVLAVWFLLPLLPLVIWAGADVWSAPARLPQAWGSRGLEQALSDGAVPALGRSAVLGLTVAALATPLGAMAARALSRRVVPLPRLVSALLLAPVALPVFAVVMGVDVTLLRLRVPGPLGLVLLLTVVALPYTTYLMRVAFGAYDVTFEEEARTLGAGPRAVRHRVRWPLLAPGLGGALFLAFLVGWGDYLVTLLVGGGQIVTLPVLIASAASGTGNEPVVAVLSLAALVPPVLALVLIGLVRRRTTGGA